jgi:hypothetical protein
LQGDEVQRYYVNRPQNPLIKVEFALRASDKPCKILIGGLRGSGKTTELSRLAINLKDDFFVVYFHAVECLDLQDINYVQVIFELTLTLYDSAIKNKININQKVIDQIKDLVSTVSLEEEKKQDGQIGGNAEFNVQVAKITGSLGVVKGRATKVTKELEPRFSELIDKFNLLIDEVQKKAKKKVVIFVEDLDKLSYQFELDLFLRYGEALYSPNCHMVYVASPSLVYEHGANAPRNSVSGYHHLLNPSVFTRDGKPNQVSIGFLRKIITARVGNNLFSEDGLDSIVIHSGGNIRELISLARQSLLETIMEDSDHINEQHTKKAIRQKQSNFVRSLTDEQIELLVALSETNELRKDGMLINLVYSHAVLEFQDEKGTWHSIHPCLRQLVKQRLSLKKPTPNILHTQANNSNASNE